MAAEPLGLRVEHCVTPGAVDRVLDALAGFWTQVPHVPETDRMLVETALAEVVGNIAEHGAALGGPGFDASLEVEVDAGEVRATLRDNGPQPDVDLDADLPDDDREAGRGFPLARRAVDVLDLRREGAENVWVLVRRLT